MCYFLNVKDGECSNVFVIGIYCDYLDVFKCLLLIGWYLRLEFLSDSDDILDYFIVIYVVGIWLIRCLYNFIFLE